MEVKEAVRAGLQEWILPELNSIRDDNAQIKTILELTNKRLDDINTHLADQSRRIDETNNRIIETNNRIDDTNNRIDGLRTEMTHRFDDMNKRIDGLHLAMVRREELDHMAERIQRIETDLADLHRRLPA